MDLMIEKYSVGCDSLKCEVMGRNLWEITGTKMKDALDDCASVLCEINKISVFTTNFTLSNNLLQSLRSFTRKKSSESTFS